MYTGGEWESGEGEDGNRVVGMRREGLLFEYTLCTALTLRVTVISHIQKTKETKE